MEGDVIVYIDEYRTNRTLQKCHYCYNMLFNPFIDNHLIHIFAHYLLVFRDSRYSSIINDALIVSNCIKVMDSRRCIFSIVGKRQKDGHDFLE